MEKNHFEPGRRSNNRKNRKAFLEQEIAKEMDPQVKLEYTKMLMTIEKEERRKKRLGWGLFILFLGGFTYFLYTLGDKADDKPRKAQTEVTTSSQRTETTQTETQAITETYEVTTESLAKELSLSTSDIKSWVMAVLDELPEPDTRYLLDVTTDKSDSLVYIKVGVDQMDGLGTFRINDQGQLEARGRITGSLVDPTWTLMSDTYMDTSIAQAYFANQRSNNQHGDSHHNNNDNEDEVESFEDAKDLVADNIDLWTDMTSEEADEIDIDSYNERLSDLQQSASGNYYDVVVETKRSSEGHGTMGSAFQFRVYQDGTIEQRSMGAGRDMWIKIR